MDTKNTAKEKNEENLNEDLDFDLQLRKRRVVDMTKEELEMLIIKSVALVVCTLFTGFLFFYFLFTAF